jgi:hypothetical protein
MGTPFKMNGFSGFGNSPLKQEKVDWSKAPKEGTYERREFYKKHNLAFDDTTDISKATQIKKGKVGLTKSEKFSEDQGWQQDVDKNQSERLMNELYLDKSSKFWGPNLKGPEGSLEANVMDSLQTAHKLSFHGINPRTYKTYESEKKK